MVIFGAVLALAGMILLVLAVYQLGCVLAFRESRRAPRGALMLASACALIAGSNACDRYWPAVVILGCGAVLSGAGWSVLRRKRAEKDETSARP